MIITFTRNFDLLYQIYILICFHISLPVASYIMERNSRYICTFFNSSCEHLHITSSLQSCITVPISTITALAIFLPGTDHRSSYDPENWNAAQLQARRCRLNIVLVHYYSVYQGTATTTGDAT